MIPTAEEYFSGNNGLYTAYAVKNKDGKFVSVCSYEKAIEFAKLHVEAALKEAKEKAKQKWIKYTDHDYEIDEDSILNAYPLSKIV